MAAAGVTLPEFSRAVQACLGQRPMSKIGLAVSGGVDSMALAHLAQQFHQLDNTKYKPIAFIVDHQSRPESTSEASHVVSLLHNAGIEARQLRLSWPSNVEPSKLSRFETDARQLRYQALGRACLEEGVTSLLLGHHRDDNAETIMQRLLVRKYYAMWGMAKSGGIPECEGIAGVDNCISWDEHSGHVSASEGIMIHRPLLSFPKSRLVATCKAARVEWVDDPTNSDHTLTSRNTVRYLLRSGRLPRAINSESLMRLGQVKRSSTACHRRRALQAVQSFGLNTSHTHPVLNLGLPFDESDSMYSGPQHPVASRSASQQAGRISQTSLGLPIRQFRDLLAKPAGIHLVGMLVNLVCPASENNHRLLRCLADQLLEATAQEPPSKMRGNVDDPALVFRSTLGSTVISLYYDVMASSRKGSIHTDEKAQPCLNGHWTLSIGRQVVQRQALSLPLRADGQHIPPSESDWQLYDGRFWMTLTSPAPLRPMVSDLPPELDQNIPARLRNSRSLDVRQLTVTDWRHIKKYVKDSNALREVEKRFPEKSKYSLPVLALPNDANSKELDVSEDAALALPTEGICVPWMEGRLTWHVVPKYVDLMAGRFSE